MKADKESVKSDKESVKSDKASVKADKEAQASFREKKAVVVYNKKKDKNILYWVGRTCPS